MRKYVDWTDFITDLYAKLIQLHKTSACCILCNRVTGCSQHVLVSGAILNVVAALSGKQKCFYRYSVIASVSIGRKIAL